jgi:CRP-like cAMP-binding protein
MDLLQKAIKDISPVEGAALTDLLAAWEHRVLPKDHLLLREHTVSDYIYFIEKGAARIFYHKKEKEVTEWVALDRQFFLSITSFFQRTPSHLIIQTLEPSSIYGIHHNDLMALADKHHAVEKMLRKMITLSLILSQQRMDSIQFETAHERYEKLVKQSPGIIQRVPLSYIASFLGVTLETLSRIRGQK